MKLIRHLGLAVLAALVLTAAVGASAASASRIASSEFEVNGVPATISGAAPEGAGPQELLFHSIADECNSPLLEAEMKASSSRELTATPKDTSCQMFGGGNTLKMNGCKLVYHPGAEKSANVFEGTFAVGPTGCGPMKIETTYCTVTIPAQTGLAAKYEIVGSGEERAVKVTPEVMTLKHTQVSGFACEHGTFSDGKWSGGSWTLKAFYKGVQTGLFLIPNNGEPEPYDLSVQGEKSTEEAKQPKLTSITYPVSITGPQLGGWGGRLLLVTNAGNAECEGAQLKGSASGPTREPAFQAEYSGCNAWGGWAGIWKMNGCEYIFHIHNEVPYRGDVAIKCPEGKAIEVVAAVSGITKCTVTIPAQTGLEGLTFTNEKATGQVAVGVGLSAIHYKQQAGSGFGACSSGEFTNGTYKGKINLVGGP